MIENNYTDEELVEMIKNNSPNVSDYILELSNRHTGLYKYIVSKFSDNDCEQSKSEILNQKEYLIYNSAVNFDNSKSKFSTHLANETKWLCLKNKNKKFKSNLSYSEFSTDLIDIINLKNLGDLNSKKHDNEFYISIALNEISKIKDRRARKIIEMRYFSLDNKNYSWKNIAKNVELSIQGCINIHNKYINKIKSKIEKEINNEQNNIISKAC